MVSNELGRVQMSNFQIFGPGSVGFRRQSLLAIFLFPFRRAGDRFDNDRDRFAEPHIVCRARRWRKLSGARPKRVS